MSLRVKDISPWCGAYRRTGRRDFHVLLNLGGGHVVFVRKNDLTRDPIWLVNQVKKCANLRVFNIRDILSEKVEPDVVEHLASNQWKICRVAYEFILENAFAVTSQPYAFEPAEIFNGSWPLPGHE